MNFLFDLHTQSTYSDGDFQPRELAKAAFEAGLKGAILTDHNTLAGTDVFKKEAKQLGLETFEGVEITSTAYGIDVHMLGYSAAFDRAILEKGLLETKEGYKQRAKESIRLLHDAGYKEVTYKELENKEGLLHSYDIARLYSEKTGIEAVKINRLLQHHGPAYVPYGDWIMTPQEAVALIHDAKGLAVLAHPGEFQKRTRLSEGEASGNGKKVISDLISCGVDGIEVFSPRHNEELRKEYLALTEKNGLLATGGSDFHGPYHHPEISFGDGGLDPKGWENVKRALHLRSTR